VTDGVPASAHWRRNQAAVTVAVFIGFTGFTLVMPFISLYFDMLGVHDPAANAIWSGLSLGVTPAITAAVAPAWARLADRVGRKVLVARSLGSFVVIMAALAAVTQPWHVLALRVVQGIFAGYGPLAMMMAADSSPKEHLATSIGWVQTAQRLGPALGPVVGGVLASTVGLRETFVIASLVYLLAFLLVIVAYREVPRAPLPHQSQTEAPVTLAALRRVPHFVLAFFAVFGLQLADRSFGPILPLYLAQAGTAASRVAFLSGVIFTVSAAAAAIGNQTTSWVMRARTASQALPPAILLSAAAAVVFGVTAPTGVLLAAASVFGLGLGLATTGVYTAAGHALPPVSRGLGMSYLSTAYLLGLAVSPIVAGLIGAASMRAVFFVDAAGLAALAWVLNRSGSDWGQTGVKLGSDLNLMPD
jgi:MFS family permease